MTLRVCDGRGGNGGISERWQASGSLESSENEAVVDLILGRAIVRGTLTGGGGNVAEVV